MRELQDVAKDPTVIIKPENKSRSIVLIDYVDYKNEALRQLSDTTFYETVSFDSPAHVMNIITVMIQEAINLGYITERTAFFCDQ